MINVIDWYRYKKEEDSILLIGFGNCSLKAQGSKIFYDPVDINYAEYRKKYVKLFNRKLPG